MFLLLIYRGSVILNYVSKSVTKPVMTGFKEVFMSNGFEAKTVISPQMKLSEFQKQEIFRQRIIERRQRKQENDLFMQVAREKHLRNQQRNKFTKIAMNLVAKCLLAGIDLRGDNK